MEALEIFLSQWRNTVLFAFSVIGVLLTIVRIYGFCQARINGVIKEAVTLALIDQRQNNQAEVLDEFIGVIKEQQQDIKEYSKESCRNADEKAAVKMFLKRRNVTLKD